MRITIKDCEVQTFRSGGKGGQNQDKRDTGVRIVHAPSGAVGESREERSQLQNKKIAFKRMAKSKEFYAWAKKQMLEEHEEVTVSDERIRTYNFVKGWVKDHRTGKKTNDIEGVMNGKLDQLR